MKLHWTIEPSDIQTVQRIIAEQQHRAFVIARKTRNVDGTLPEISQSQIWQTQMMCLLTSQQRSGPGSPVFRFLSQKPFPLSLPYCRRASDAKALVANTLDEYGGIRFASNIGKRAATNYEGLEAGGWDEIERWIARLGPQRAQSPDPTHYQLERQAAEFIDSTFEGFGPKQSRNFWQALGLTRYEFVLDSRITDWLQKNGFPFPLSSTALGDRAYYVFLSDILRELCIRADILPCILDAAIFASYDKQDWFLDALL